MAEFTIQPDTLELIKQLAERQGEHLDAIIDHLNSHTTLTDIGGLIMGVLGPMYHSGRDNAVDGFEQGKAVCDAVARAAQESKQAYLEADEACRAGLESVVGSSGIEVPPARSPGSDVHLPPATGVIRPAPDDSTGFVGRAWEHTTGAAEDARDGFHRVGQAGGNSYADQVLPREGVHPGVEAMDQARIRRPFDSMVQTGVDRAWGWADDRFGDPGATSTLQERFEQRQYAAWGRNYDSGLTTTNSSPTPYASSWVDDNMSMRTWQTGQDVASLYGQTHGAYHAVNTAGETADSLQRVQDVADGASNSASHDWAQDR